jgi:capsular polysaccharide biosynthesis protein
MRLVRSLLGRRWLILAVATVIAGLAAAAGSLAVPESHRAEAVLVVTGPEASRERQLTFADLLKRDEYLAVPAGLLGISVESLSDGLRTIPAPGTLLVAVTVTNRHESRAIERANAVADSFPGWLVSRGLAGEDAVAIVERAANAKSQSVVGANGVAGAALGLLAAAGAFAYLDRRSKAQTAVELSPTDDSETVESE